MKRIKAVHVTITVAILAAVANAAPDTEPWRKIYEQRQHVVPQKFDVEVQATFIDAGTIKLSGTIPLIKTTLLDAGSGMVNGDLVITGTGTVATAKVAVLDAGVAFFNGEVAITGTTTSTTCTLDGASPAVCTATVRAGSKCQCSLVGTTAAIAAMNCAVSLSGTTLTVTAANAANAVVNVLCF